MARELTGAEVRAAMEDAAGDQIRWYNFHMYPDGESNSWTYQRIYLEDDSGWWCIFFQRHNSGDKRENGLVFKLHPVVRHVEMVERVRSWTSDETR